MSQVGFQDSAFVLMDRLVRTVEELRDQLRTADEYIMACQQRVQDVVDKQGPGLPSVVLSNGLPQTMGFQAGWVDGHFTVHVGHRAEDGMNLLPPGQQAEIEVAR